LVLIKFCDNCGSILKSSMRKGKKILVCDLCDKITIIDANLRDTYVITKVIEHPKREQ
jgi:DNA-directed RNA polymerase subunit M/transcription elongation factor TFIIS